MKQSNTFFLPTNKSVAQCDLLPYVDKSKSQSLVLPQHTAAKKNYRRDLKKVGILKNSETFRFQCQFDSQNAINLSRQILFFFVSFYLPFGR